MKYNPNLINTCACGEYGLKKGAFTKHIKQYHNGIALPLNQKTNHYDTIGYSSTQMQPRKSSPPLIFPDKIYLEDNIIYLFMNLK